MQRRTPITSLAGLLVGGTATAIVTESTQAQSTLAVNSLNVSGAETTTDTIQDIQLTVDTTYTYETTITPTRGTLRLEANHANGFTQVSAESLDNLSKDKEETITLSGSLLTLEGLNTDSVPDERGATNTFDIEIRVMLELYDNGEIIAETRRTDTATISISKTDIQVESAIGGEGTITIQTE